MSSTGPFSSLILAQAGTAQKLSAVRIAQGRTSLEAFIGIYLSQHAKLAFSSMHRDLFGLLERGAVRRGVRTAIAAPRGHAKSTVVSLAYVLWSIVYGLEDYILLLSDTADQAGNLLSFIKHEIESNERVRADFPAACAVPPVQARPARWRKQEIITGNGVKLTALGVDSKVRGRRHNQHRPGLIIVDDCENDESVRNPEQRQRLAEWFERAVLKAGTPTTNTIVMGTIFHYASLLAKLTDPQRSPGWGGRIYQAVISFADRRDLWDRWEAVFAFREKYAGSVGPAAAQAFFEAQREEMLRGSEVLWPQCETYLDLMTLRLCEGRASFDSEKQNQPGATGDGCFLESDFVYWDQEFATEEALLASFPPGVMFFGALDPSLGKQGANRDDSAIVTVARHPITGVLYVLDADIRKRRPDEIIQAAIAYHRQRGYSDFAVESNQFQEFLADELIKRGREASCPVPVRAMHQSGDKLGRMQGLQPLVTSGQVRLCRKHVTLLEQMRQFPHGAHDDGPDALEMAVQEGRHYFECPKGRFFSCPQGGGPEMLGLRD